MFCRRRGPLLIFRGVCAFLLWRFAGKSLASPHHFSGRHILCCLCCCLAYISSYQPRHKVTSKPNPIPSPCRPVPPADAAPVPTMPPSSSSREEARDADSTAPRTPRSAGRAGSTSRRADAGGGTGATSPTIPRTILLPTTATIPMITPAMSIS